jgi:hypothetical protein
VEGLTVDILSDIAATRQAVAAALAQLDALEARLRADDSEYADYLDLCEADEERRLRAYLRKHGLTERPF